MSSPLTVLLDPERLAVAGAIALTPRAAGEVAAQAGIDHRRVIELIGDLRAAGLAEQAGDGWQIPAERLRDAAAAFAEREVAMDPSIGFGMTDEECVVLERYFSGRVLNEIPQTRSKRVIVLERLGLEFVPGQRYPEAEVDRVLRAFHFDVPALRRHLIDEGILDRERVDDETQYFRSGGRI